MSSIRSCDFFHYSLVYATLLLYFYKADAPQKTPLNCCKDACASLYFWYYFLLKHQKNRSKAKTFL